MIDTLSRLTEMGAILSGPCPSNRCRWPTCSICADYSASHQKSYLRPDVWPSRSRFRPFGNACIPSILPGFQPLRPKSAVGTNSRRRRAGWKRMRLRQGFIWNDYSQRHKRFVETKGIGVEGLLFGKPRGTEPGQALLGAFGQFAGAVALRRLKLLGCSVSTRAFPRLRGVRSGEAVPAPNPFHWHASWLARTVQSHILALI